MYCRAGCRECCFEGAVSVVPVSENAAVRKGGQCCPSLLLRHDLLFESRRTGSCRLQSVDDVPQTASCGVQPTLDCTNRAIELFCHLQQ